MSSLEQLVAILRDHEGELRAAGIGALSVYGSAARGEDQRGSDIDLAVRLDAEAHVGLFGFVGLEHRLTRLLGRRVQLLPEPVENTRLTTNLERDRRRVF